MLGAKFRLFKAIKNGSVEVVTDEIDIVTSDGLQLKSGMKLPADILVTATGLKLSVLADVPFTVDGQAIDFSSLHLPRYDVFRGAESRQYFWVR